MPGYRKGEIKDLVGQTFGRLLVVSFVGLSHHNQTIFHCKCICGKELDILGHSLTTGHSKSCGCLKKESDIAKIKRNGKDNPAWKGVKFPFKVALRNHPKYKEWVAKVLTRSKYTCLMCKQVGGKLEVHHKKPLAQLLRENNIQTLEEGLRCKAIWYLKNGIALCIKCHDMLHHTKKNRTTTKPWGAEILFEVNDRYAVKRLVMWAGHKCSLQRHLKKRETFILLSGTMLFTHNGKQRRLKPGAFFTVTPDEVHRMEAITDIVYLECSTPELDDVERLEDDYSRI